MSKEKRFKGWPEETVWLPLTAILIDCHNLAMTLSKGEDESYCKTIAWIHDMLLPLYVDAGELQLDLFNRFFVVFVYVIEQKMNLSQGENCISVYKVFDKVKKYWDEDIK